eukprot:ctg_2637.g463
MQWHRPGHATAGHGRPPERAKKCCSRDNASGDRPQANPAGVCRSVVAAERMSRGNFTSAPPPTHLGMRLREHTLRPAVAIGCRTAVAGRAAVERHTLARMCGYRRCSCPIAWGRSARWWPAPPLARRPAGRAAPARCEAVRTVEGGDKTPPPPSWRRNLPTQTAPSHPAPNRYWPAAATPYPAAPAIRTHGATAAPQTR